MIRRSRRRVAFWILAVTAALAPACATQQMSSTSTMGSGALPGLGPVLTVERFLQAANLRDWATMMSLFGTEDGPVDWDRQYGERHMNLLAEILQHEDYEIGEESAVPGRRAPTRQVLVTLEQASRTVEDVPFLVVDAGNGSWLVEEIATDRITGR